MKMQTYRFKDLQAADLKRLCTRPGGAYEELFPWVKETFELIARQGDPAVRDLIRKFDKTEVRELEVSAEEIRSAEEKISSESASAIEEAISNLRAFHQLQIPAACEAETSPGVRCRREWRPIARAGLYVPGGRAPLVSTVLMLGVPAALAGCPEVVLCTPAGRGGRVVPEILFAARKCGVHRVFRVGGAQAIGAMAVGTETIPGVDKIFGPGNRYVTAAKAYCAGHAGLPGIDMLAGPSELMVIADRTANPAWIAADLLSQAEHGADSQVVLVAFSEKLVDEVEHELAKQSSEALSNAYAILVETREQAIRFSNAYGPEHLELCVEDPAAWAPLVESAGSVFLGNYASVVFGDYASGTNHTLPTNATARYSGALCVESFMKPVLFQNIAEKGFAALSESVIRLAELEGLQAHAAAIAIRREA